MKKRSKKINKKMVLSVFLLILIIIIVTIIIVNKNKNNNMVESDVTELENTVYENMEVKNINMEYSDENNQTAISMTINNSTDNNIENETVNVILLNEEGNQISEMQTYIMSLGTGEEYDISVILKGDLRETKKIELIKVE